jgi:hypothetical protein
MDFARSIKRNSNHLLFWWIAWYFWSAPRDILRITRSFLRFGLSYFSIPLLLKTLFAPWRQYVWQYPRGFSLKEYASVFFSNVISRTIGAVTRTILIIVGLMAEFLMLVTGLIIFLFWFFSGPLAIGLIILGGRCLLGI